MLQLAFMMFYSTYNALLLHIKALSLSFWSFPLSLSLKFSLSLFLSFYIFLYLSIILPITVSLSLSPDLFPCLCLYVHVCLCLSLHLSQVFNPYLCVPFVPLCFPSCLYILYYPIHLSHSHSISFGTLTAKFYLQ